MNDRNDAHRARTRLESHRWWPYRACAESPDVPGVSAADETVPLTAWLNSDTETQDERHRREYAALRLCAGCPIRQECLTYALAHEPQNIWGGMTAYQRRELLLDRRRAAVPAATPRRIPVTNLDLRVLRALAQHRSQRAVARSAGMTVTRANWHRSRIVTFLGLDPRVVTRGGLLRAAHSAGLIPAGAPWVDDGRRIIAALPSRQDQVVRARGVQLALPGMERLRAGRPVGVVRRLPVRHEEPPLAA